VTRRIRNFAPNFNFNFDSLEGTLRENESAVTIFYPGRPSTDSSRWIFVAPQASTQSFSTGSSPFVADIEVSCWSLVVLKKTDFISQLYVAVPPDSGYGWVIAACTICLKFIIDGILHSHGKLKGSMAETLDSGSVQIATLWSVQIALCYMMFPVASALINGFGLRRVGVIGSLVCAVGFAAASFVDHFLLVMLFYSVLGGVGLGVVNACASIVVNFYFERHRALVTTLGASGSGLGIATVPTLVHLLLNQTDQEWDDVTFYYAGACIGMACICLLLRSVKPVLVELPAERKVTFEFNSSQRIPERGEQWPYKYPSLRDMLNNPRISLLEFHRTYKFANRLISDTQIDQLEEEVKNLLVRARPMYRHDIFFFSTLRKLTEYKNFMEKPMKRDTNQARIDNLKYHLYVSRVISIESQVSVITISAPVWRVLELLFDPGLLKVRTFRLLAFIHFFISLGYFTPIYHLLEYTNKQTLADDQLLMALIGCAFVLGHVVVNLLNCKRPHFKASAVCGLQLVIMGGVTMLAAYPHRKNLGQVDQYAFVLIYGMTMAGVISLRSLVLVTHMGLENLTNAFGLINMFLGLGALLGTPLAAAMCSDVDKFEPAFLFSGGCHIAAGMLFFVILRCDLYLGIW
jgi:MFS transporter, MCT family, solute carrier family 16 (monocarboxylic acid transporters), member 14